ncbi:MAG TPA: hypothetical protein PKH39_12050, partial [Woeseiaceae bacterium]|nr:hypothetical protein [Woeseiaceae bacterium]
AEARRRAAEADRKRREAEYLAQFGVAMPPDAPESASTTPVGNTPLAVIPENHVADEPTAQNNATVPATDGGNAPANTTQSEEPPPTDLESIRDELARRNEESSDPP